MLGVEVSDTCSPAYIRDMIEMERTARMIDVKNIEIGSKITLSDGSLHILKHIGVGKNFHDIDFEDGYSVYDFSNNGVSDVNPCLHITAVEPPRQEVDLSTLMVGDVCITRDGESVPWNRWRHYNRKNWPFEAFSKGGARTYNKDGLRWKIESNKDIVRIVRASDEQLKFFIDHPMLEIGD